MAKKIIRDIRLLKGGMKNGFGEDVTTSFAHKKLNAITQRIVMKLREKEFSFGEYDHLYIHFIPSSVAQNMHLSDKVDRYHPWLRNCYVPIDAELYDNLCKPESYAAITDCISTVLVTCFATEDFDEARIHLCVQQAVEQGERMLMKYKEKCSAKRKAVVFLRYLDTCKFYPLLQVYDAEDHLLLEKDLPESVALDYLGDIQVSAKRVTIKPRKNAFTKQTNPLVFEY
jgi:hypothetical protein